MVTTERRVITMKGSCACGMPGVWRAAAHNRGAVVVFHSPKACTHLIRDMEVSDHYRALARHESRTGQYLSPLICSGITEEHAIFGGVDLLRQCLDEVVTGYQPQYIVIANSCVAGVIGDDTQAVAARAEQKWGIPMLAIPGHGFLEGDYHAGFYDVGQALAERFMSPQPRQENTITLLGDGGGPNSAGLLEMKELLGSFGLRVNCHFPGYASLAEIRRVPAAALTIIFGGRPQSYTCLRKLAVFLEARFGTPFFDFDYPVGWDGTKTWLMNLGHLLGRNAAALLAVSQQAKRLELQLAAAQSLLKGLPTLLCIGRPLGKFDLAWILELLSLAQVSLLGVILLAGLTPSQQAELQQELGQKVNAPFFDQSGGAELGDAAQLFITTHELALVDQRQFFLPILPPVGVGGLLRLMNKLKRLAQRSPQRGGIVYG
jgi:nitrogenase molybdenum-iron protein alpha chain